jgi:hypothetical protein
VRIRKDANNYAGDRIPGFFIHKKSRTANRSVCRVSLVRSDIVNLLGWINRQILLIAGVGFYTNSNISPYSALQSANRIAFANVTGHGLRRIRLVVTNTPL